MREWNAEAYHRVSAPHVAWGVRVLERLPLRGDECVLDVGCGTGRLTAILLDRLAAGRVVGLDVSSNMLAAARTYLSPRFGARISFVRADAAALPMAGYADAVFSTATFHWVPDHPALFRSVFGALKPGGRLVAQCGGGPNIQRLHDRCAVLGARPEFARYFSGWHGPWNFADADTTARRLEAAGFVDVRTNVEAIPVVQPDAGSYREFVTNVICHPHLARLPEQSLRERFLDVITEQASRDAPAFELDYWRLNMEARKPASREG
jgi:trans-aconitate 2-methyltransferase